MRASNQGDFLHVGVFSLSRLWTGWLDTFDSAWIDVCASRVGQMRTSWIEICLPPQTRDNFRHPHTPALPTLAPLPQLSLSQTHTHVNNYVMIMPFKIRLCSLRMRIQMVKSCIFSTCNFYFEVNTQPSPFSWVKSMASNPTSCPLLRPRTCTR